MAKRRTKGRTTKRKTKATTRPTRSRRSPAARARSRQGAPDVEVPANWDYDLGGKAISVEVTTKDFLQAVDLINELAKVAEALEHHPDLHLTSWNHLKITTYSHDMGRLTSRDARLAGRVNEVLGRRGLGP